MPTILVLAPPPIMHTHPPHPSLIFVHAIPLLPLLASLLCAPLNFNLQLNIIEILYGHITGIYFSYSKAELGRELGECRSLF